MLFDINDIENEIYGFRCYLASPNLNISGKDTVRCVSNIMLLEQALSLLNIINKVREV